HRLSPSRATGMNLSRVFGLYPDELGEVQERLDAAVGRALPVEATDHLGVVSRMWPVTDPQAVSAVTGLMGPKPVFIADGHHRYETGLKYLDERRAARGGPRDEGPADLSPMVVGGLGRPAPLGPPAPPPGGDRPAPPP